MEGSLTSDSPDQSAIFPVVCYIFYTGFSGTQLYNDTSISAWNLVFTSLPVLAFALLEQDVGRELSLQHPMVYREGPQGKFLNTGKFLTWMAEAAMGAIVILVVLYVEAYLCLSPRGHEVSKTMLDIMCFTCVLSIVTCRLGLETRSWTLVHLVCYTVSPMLWFVFLAAEGLSPSGILTDGTMYWDIFYMLRWPGFYFTIALATMFALLPSLVVKVYITTYHPTPAEKVMRDMRELQLKEQAERHARITSPERTASRLTSEVFSDLADRTAEPDTDSEEKTPSAWNIIRGDQTLGTTSPLGTLRAAANASRFLARVSKEVELKRSTGDPMEQVEI